MIMQEVLLQVQWGIIYPRLADQPSYKEDPVYVTAIRKLRDCLTLQGAKDFLALPEMQQLHQFYLNFCREDRDPMAGYWISYKEMVGLFKTFLRATPEGD